MFDNARLLDLIEHALDADPFCPVCGAPTTIKDDDGRLWLVCSAAARAPSASGRASALRSCRIRGSCCSTCRSTSPPDLAGMRGRCPLGTLAPWRSSSRRSTQRSSTPRPRLDIDAATRRHAELAAAVDRANELYHVEDAPEISDAEYDAAVPRARRARDGLPGADDLGFADAAGRRHADRHLRRGPPRPPDAVALERLQPRRAAGVRCAGCGAGSACRPPRSPPRSCATSPSSRSTASRSACATSAAGSSRARPAATGRPART